MTKNSKLSQEMIDANKIARAKQRIASLGLDPEDIMPKLQAKMGQYACDFVFQAMRYPGELCNRTGETFQKSRALISTYANDDISDERLAKALGAKTKKEAEAKSIKIQESKVKYLAKRDLQALVNSDVAGIQQEAAEKQKQAVLRINRRTQDTQKEAVLKPAEKEEKQVATVAPVNEQSAVLEPAKTKAESTQTPTPQSTGFKLEPLAPDSWQAASLMTAPTEPEVQVPLDSRRIAEEEARAKVAAETKAAAEEPVIEGSPEAIARQKAQEELAKLKEGKTGELTLEELTQAGISDADMERTVTMDNITEIHAGASAMKSAKAAPRYHRGSGCAYNVRKALEAGGLKGSTYDRNERITSGRKRGNAHNGTTQCRTLRNKDGFYTFEFDSNLSGNPEIANLKEPGTYIGWEAKPDSIQPLGHGAVMDTKGVWHGGLKQDAQYMSSSAPAKRYKSDTYTVGFFGDCTASDKLAEDMLYQKYLREEREKMTTKVILAQNELDK